MTQEINVDSAIERLKNGENLEGLIISDLSTSKVRMIDALLLVRNGYIVPEQNVVYDDAQIQYDPDFDDVIWGRPVPFKQLKQSLESDDQVTEPAELVVHLKVKNTDMKQWLVKNGDQINLVISDLLESMYRAAKQPEP